MKVTIDIKAGPHHTDGVQRSDIQRNIDALNRAIEDQLECRDGTLLRDTRTILEAIRRELPPGGRAQVGPMKTRYKHIHFEATCFNGVFSCLTNKGDMELGVVGPGAWKRITFRPDELTEFSGDCLADIIHFIGQLEARP